MSLIKYKSEWRKTIKVHFPIVLLDSTILAHIKKGKSLVNYSLQGFYSTQTRYEVGKTRETKRIYCIDNQLFEIFLYLVILPIFACFLLDSTLLVHFNIQNFLVYLQNKKTSENKRVNDFTRFDTHLGT